MNPTENETLGLALNLLEALNGMILNMTKRNYSTVRKVFIHLKIEKVIELMDAVLCQMDKCAWCGADIKDHSYFIRVDNGLLEVCPECHHWHAYAPKDMLEVYKKRRNIKL